VTGSTAGLFRDCAGNAARRTGLRTFSVSTGIGQSPFIAKHEFGHAAFELGDEYTEANSTRNVAPAPAPGPTDSNCCCSIPDDGTGIGTGIGTGNGTGRQPRHLRQPRLRACRANAVLSRRPWICGGLGWLADL
jgi:hypothetical protein